jgi:hypothetical protein
VQGYLSAGEAAPCTRNPKDRGHPLTAAALLSKGAALPLTADALRPPAQAILPLTQAFHLPAQTFHLSTAAVLRPPAWASWTPRTVRTRHLLAPAVRNRDRTVRLAQGGARTPG